MGDFIFRIAPEIILGQDTLNRLPLIAARYGNRAILIADPVANDSKTVDRTQSLLESNKIKTLLFDEIPQHSASKTAEEAINLAKGAKPNLVIGLGGERTLAIAKSCAMMAQAGNDVDSVLDGALPDGPALPYIAIPTAIRDPFLLQDLTILSDSRDRTARLVKAQPFITKAVIMDPNLTLDISAKMSALLCMDLVMITTEAYVSTKSSFFSDTVAENAFRYLFQAIDSFIKSPDDPQGRVLAMHGSFLSSLAAATSSIGIGSAINYSVNARFGVPKASLGAILLPYILEESSKARVEKIAKIASFSGEIIEGVSPRDAALQAAEAIRQRLGSLKVPTRLKDFDLDLDRLVEIASIARGLEMINYLPAVMSIEDIFDLIKQAF